MMFKYFKWTLVLSLILSFVLFYTPKGFAASDEEIQALKAQVRELTQRIEKMEAEQAQSKAEVAKAKEEPGKVKDAQASRVDLANTLSKLKMKGRYAAGFYESGKDGSYPKGSFEAPEAKLQFNFYPDDINTVIMRMSLNNATFNNLDYFYLDTKLSKYLNMPFELNSRIGKMKVDYGEETWWNNPVEDVLASTSAANAGCYDIGAQLGGKILIGALRPIGWAASVTNGIGAGSDTTRSKAISAKLFYNIFDPLYASISYYDSGAMGTGSAAMSIAGLKTAPTGATNWERKMWETDLRYDFGKGKIQNPPAYSDSKAFVRLAYGEFFDDPDSTTTLYVPNRTGQYGYVDGTYNLTKKIYTAARYSVTDLYGNGTALLNSATANKYQRYSLGGGYHFTDATIIKVGYDWNIESGDSITHLKNDQISAIVSSQF